MVMTSIWGIKELSRPNRNARFRLWTACVRLKWLIDLLKKSHFVVACTIQFRMGKTVFSLYFTLSTNPTQSNKILLMVRRYPKPINFFSFRKSQRLWKIMIPFYCALKLACRLLPHPSSFIRWVRVWFACSEYAKLMGIPMNTSEWPPVIV